VTPTHYTWLTFDKDGQATRTQGGPYEFDGEVLKSTPEYGMGPGVKWFYVGVRCASCGVLGCIGDG
jgi:hypothetical protein